ncbi:MAG: FAD binding domain-containing protein [Eubacteriales bacterium]|nr:FAD binding domain-containing protein [Eubacteriales bacterium]
MAVAVYPRNLAEALRILEIQSPLVLAGGTDLMVKRAGTYPDECPVMYIGNLPELRQISRQGEELRVGAACTFTELLASPLLPDYLRVPLAQIASPAIRNAATIGGNLCNASPAADALPMLYALDAHFILVSAAGECRMPVRDFFLGPGKTMLAAGQLLAEIRIPIREGWRCIYRKVGMRRANSLSKLSFYALSDCAGGRLQDIRIAFGAVAPTVVRSREAEMKILSGLPVEEIILMYNGLIKPIDDARSSSRYRREACIRLLKQYLQS